MPKTLGERIRELRAAKDLSLREFAKKLGGLSAAFLSDIELGRRHPSDKVLAEMAHVLGSTVEDLRAHDARPPVEELKRLTSTDPAWGLAFRRVLKQVAEEKILPEELLRFLGLKKGLSKKR
jgi:transcriptional regulator with XRE-family HTH domain